MPRVGNKKAPCFTMLSERYLVVGRRDTLRELALVDQFCRCHWCTSLRLILLFEVFGEDHAEQTSTASADALG